MAIINAIGLGPGAESELTLRAVSYINRNIKNYIRTEQHPAVSYFINNNKDFISFDTLYEKSDSFEELYSAISKKLISAAKLYGEINYFVPGHPLVAEKTIQQLLASDEVEVNIVAGLSFIEPVLECVKKDPVEGFKLLDALTLNSYQIDIHADTLITQTYSQKILSDVKLMLSDIYGDEYKVYLIDKAGIPNDEKVIPLAIYELDRIGIASPQTSVYIPRINEKNKKIHDLNDAFMLVKTLRGEDGCLWDREQDHSSLRKCVIEEAYELVEAIDDKDNSHIMEELGDLLFQAIFHICIAEENGDFNQYEVTSSLVNKLITRHPHVFFEKNLAKSSDIVYNWNQIKYKDRNLNSLKEKMLSIPRLPELLRAYKIQEKAAEVGFDWDDIKGPIDKLNEESEELIEAITTNEDVSRIEDELGDVLFSVVNIARFLGIDPEIALSKTIRKFIKRLDKVELKAKKVGIVMEEMTLQELDSLWNEAKLEQ